MPTTFERGGEERAQNFFRQSNANNSCTDTEHVGVVVRARQSRGEKVVAQGRAYTAHLVGGHLLALPAAAENNSDVCSTITHGAADFSTDWRVIDGGGAVGSKIADDVPVARQHRNEVLLQFVAGVICANRDSGHPSECR